MAASSISSGSPIMSASVMKNLKGPGTRPEAHGGMKPASISTLAGGQGSIRKGLQIIPSPNDAAGALQSSARQIARLQSNPAQPTARAASFAYLTQSAAQTQDEPNQQPPGSLRVNVTA
jgi:hypothetical protein